MIDHPPSFFLQLLFQWFFFAFFFFFFLSFKNICARNQKKIMLAPQRVFEKSFLHVSVSKRKVKIKPKKHIFFMCIGHAIEYVLDDLHKKKKKMLRINGRGDTSTVIESIWEVIEDELYRQSKYLGYSMSTVSKELREMNERDKERAVSFVLSNSRDKFCEYIESCELTKEISIEGQWLMWDAISQKVMSMDLSKIVSPSQSRTLFHNNVHRDDNNDMMNKSMPSKANEDKKTPEGKTKKQRQTKLSVLLVSGFQCLIKKANHEHDEQENGTNSEKMALKTTTITTPTKVRSQPFLLEKNWKDCVCNEKGRTYHVQLKPPANHSLKPSLSATRTISSLSNTTSCNNTRDKDDIFICV
ncbi:hypothetical protein RFI_25484 [Reticulomyxa filosa]|uniref:Uncharacterized protein n=1 Tax=Reticulomyxa filosa TaxID=46433 RepID=X6ME36_RETFI|nr:hypothetical protein RFI_25484 [Reticulomyxa filosa]|eukprot:ETO11891.1 hypothetical protein RFI_25484 [Reticulomyxa filosa]